MAVLSLENVTYRYKNAQRAAVSGISCEFDLTNKKFVKQLEKASKTAKFALILGEDEISSNQVTVKNLETSEQKTVAREDVFKII